MRSIKDIQRQIEIDRLTSQAVLEIQLAFLEICTFQQTIGAMLLNPNVTEEEMLRALAIMRGEEYVPPPRPLPDARWFAC